MARAGAAGAASLAGRRWREAAAAFGCRGGWAGLGRAGPVAGVGLAGAAARRGAPARGEHGALVLGLCRRQPGASCSAGAPASGKAPTSTPGGSWWRRSTSTRCECGPGEGAEEREGGRLPAALPCRPARPRRAVRGGAGRVAAGPRPQPPRPPCRCRYVTRGRPARRGGTRDPG